MWSEVCHRERRQLATWTSFGRVAALGAAAGGIAMPQSQRFARCWYTTVIARAVLLYRSHSASRGAAMPQSLRFALCCFATVIASRGAAMPQSSLRAVLVFHRHCASRGAAMLCHSHRFARCWFSTDSALRAVLLCYATVIASRGAGSLTRLGNRVVRCRVVGCGDGRLM